MSQRYTDDLMGELQEVIDIKQSFEGIDDANVLATLELLKQEILDRISKSR